VKAGGRFGTLRPSGLPRRFNFSTRCHPPNLTKNFKLGNPQRR